MFWKSQNATLTRSQSLAPPYVASSSRSTFPHQSTTHAPPQFSASEPPQATFQTSFAAPTRVVMHKNDLNSYCQKLGIPFPVYQTTSEGFAHAPRFRSTVTVGKRSFSSRNTFATRKSAEQDVAKLALQHLPTEDEAWSIRQQRESLHEVCLSSAPPTRVVVNSMLMHDLNRYCQKLGIPFPVYQTTSEGFAHALRFRSTVTVGERSFTSNIFGNKKSAEQDVAKLALEHLRTEDEALSTPTREYLLELVCQDKARCMMILDEFAAKIKMECMYETTVQVENPPVFVSSLVLNGNCYKGEGGKTKNEAEQLAALGAILFLLDDPTYSTTISKVIASKLDSGAAFCEAKDLPNTRNCSGTSVNKVNTLPQTEKLVPRGASAVTFRRSSYVNLPMTSPLSSEPQRLVSQQIRGPIVSSVPQPPEYDLDFDSASSSRKRQWNKKAEIIKRLRAENK